MIERKKQKLLTILHAACAVVTAACLLALVIITIFK